MQGEGDDDARNANQGDRQAMDVDAPAPSDAPTADDDPVDTLAADAEDAASRQATAKAKGASKRKAEAAKRRAQVEQQTAALLTRWSDALAPPTMPAAKWPEEQTERALAQLRACDAVSAEAPPSCCMFSCPQVPRFSTLASRLCTMVLLPSAVGNMSLCPSCSVEMLVKHDRTILTCDVCSLQAAPHRQQECSTLTMCLLRRSGRR